MGHLLKIGGAPSLEMMMFDSPSFTGNVPIIGNVARDCLSPGRRGVVFAAVNHANYLLTDEGELLWLTTPHSPKHRRCLQLPEPLPRLTVGSTFIIQGQSINFEEGTSLNLDSSQIWEKSALLTCDAFALGPMLAKLIGFFESFLIMESPIGFGSFILPILQIVKKRESDNKFQPDNLLTIAAWPVVESITRCCLLHDLPGVMDQAETLIGLGEGLTPSGDDFLGGLLFARYLFAHAYPHLSYLESSNLLEWIGGVQPRTNLISFVLLKDNVDGHALEPLNRFGLAFLLNNPVQSLYSSASALIKVGHSTGWNLLTGFLVGTLLAIS
jgi:hypothetical protein